MYRSNFSLALWLTMGLINGTRLIQGIWAESTSWEMLSYTFLTGVSIWFVTDNLSKPNRPLDSK
jgi:hypothetical protein